MRLTVLDLRSCDGIIPNWKPLDNPLSNQNGHSRIIPLSTRALGENNAGCPKEERFYCQCFPTRVEKDAGESRFTPTSPTVFSPPSMAGLLLPYELSARGD